MATLTRSTLAALQNDINAALAAIGEKHGMKLTTGSCSFNPMNAVMKLNIATIGEDGSVETKEMTDLKRYGIMYGLTDAQLNSTFKHGGVDYKLVGYRTKASKNPFIIQPVDGGQRLIVSAQFVNRVTGANISTF